MNFAVEWTWMEIGLMILGIALVLFWEFRFQPSRRRIPRVVCSLFAVAALFLLYLRPSVMVDATIKTGVILTEPITTSQKDSILQSEGVIEMHSIQDPGEVPYTLEAILVHGDGLEAWQMSRFEGYPIELKALSPEEGLMGVQVPEIIEGIPFEMALEIKAKSPMAFTMVSPDGESTNKSIAVGEAPYHFSGVIKTAGLFQYEFVATRDQDTIFSETLPVQVSPSRKANVLLLGAFPSFEWNYLKNHLADLGFGVASRFQLSQEVFHTEFLNMPKTNLSNINSSLLDQFKLVLIDGATFDGLDIRQKRTIFRAVELAQVGLFLMIDDLSEIAAISRINTIRGEGEVLVATSEKQIRLLKMPFSVRDQNWSSLSFQGQEVGALMTRGIGKIGFSMIANSHVLELQGTPEVYGQLWDQLLSPIVGFDISDNPFYIPSFNFVNHQSDISFSHFGQPQVVIDGQLIPPINSPVRPDFWTVSYWPSREGWHSIEIDGQEATHFFVHGSNDWVTLQRFEKQRYNQLFFATNQVEERSIKQIEKPISRWIPLLIFLLAMTGLWLERKLS
ncbi:MAG: hypothetical protein R8G66_33645 [Cytophagales bacterium]|nr:hypothetical protein [Cytophagales bacterium]